MNLTSPRVKALSVSIGISLWIFVLTTVTKTFSIEYYALFLVIIFSLTQLFAKKISRGLNVFAIINTKVFLSIIFVSVISFYGIFFRILKIDLLRSKRNENTYWLEIENQHQERILKQY